MDAVVIPLVSKLRHYLTPAKIDLATTIPFRRRVTLPRVGLMRIKRIVVQSSAGPYSVVCGAGVLRHAAKEIAKLGKFSSVHIVSSAKVWRGRGQGGRDAGGSATPRVRYLCQAAATLQE